MAIPKLRLITSDRQFSANFQTLAMGVHIADGRYVEAGARITTQSMADNLPFASKSRSLKTVRKHLSVNPSLKLINTQKQNATTNYFIA
jgi:hypothetical protein